MHRCPHAVAALVVCSLAACTEKKDLSPPPLNPNPREALHITISFDHPEDAKRYKVTMNALYQNQQRECGYIDPLRGGGFRYPRGMFDVPNLSSDPVNARFDVYLDKFNRATCNWEFASPDFVVHDTATGRKAMGAWGLREDLEPGAQYHTLCQFSADDLLQMCFGRRPPPNVAHYSEVPVSVRVSIDSAPLRPRGSSFFDSKNFVTPVSEHADASKAAQPPGA